MKKAGRINVIIIFTICLVVFLISGYTLYANPVYIYGDGNGNTYIISWNFKGKTLEYKPVKPENSSSGEYDGGKYIKKKLNDIQYNEITSIIDKAVKNKKVHIKDRIKMSGMITIQKAKNKTTCIIKPGSKEQIEIEKTLKKALK